MHMSSSAPRAPRRWRVLVALPGAGLLSLALLGSAGTPAVLSAGLAAGPALVQLGSPTPADPDKIAAALVRRGVLAKNASPDQRDAAVRAYLQQKVASGAGSGPYNPMASKRVDANEAALDASSPTALSTGDTRGRKLGGAETIAASQPQFKPVVGSDKLLLILVDFSATPYTWTPDGGTAVTRSGPLHNEIAPPNNDFDLYVKDFSRQHYEDMLFTPGGWTMPSDAPHYAGQHFGSMHDYFVQQSLGTYTVDGDAYGWYTVDKPEAYYGDDRPDTGNDNRLPGTTRDLIADAVAKVNAASAIDWAAYDTNDDCVVDHPLFIHAGIDQSGGGGAQGDDSLWAHSSSVSQQVAVTAQCPSGLYIRNYTLMPEDGGVGVFAHEFAHDLGLPDEYDTIYSGRGDSNAFWSLQSSGSWLGRPAQAEPAAMSIWGRYSLGWVTPQVTTVGRLATDGAVAVRLEQAERWGGDGTANAARVSLPPKPFYVNTPHSGTAEWFGGKADQADNTLRRAVDLTGKTSASLSFWTWYDIEENWDFGFVQASTDGGATWHSLPIAGTTSVIDPEGMPEIAANLPGFTGNSGGWVQKTFDLAAYVGQPVLLQFRYMTDWGTTMAGFYVDDVSVTADGATVFADDAETSDPAWVAHGWTRDAGSGTKSHYYLMEWRNTAAMETPWSSTSIVNFDYGLTHAYQTDPNAANVDQPWYFPYAPGLLLWYRDLTYTDNWTGVHPGGGFLLVVDAHPQPMLRPPYLNYGALPWNSRVQSYDAAFGLSPEPDIALSYWGTQRTLAGLPAQPVFDDSQPYWSSKAPAASVITPKYGLVLRVSGTAPDGSAALVTLSAKK